MEKIFKISLYFQSADKSADIWTIYLHEKNDISVDYNMKIAI